MSEKQFKLSSETVLQYQIMDNDTDLNENEVVDLLNEMFEKLNKKQEKSVELFFKYKKLKEENEQLRNELTFLNKVISFFADNPMTKYSSKSELLEEMKLLEEMGLI